MRKLDLNALSDPDRTGLSPRYGGFMAEAATICLIQNGHPNPVNMDVEGHIKETYEVQGIALHPNAPGSFADTQEATEYAAMGVAVALLCEEKKLQVERSPKDGGGFDFWVGDKDDSHVFQNKARLEVSGVLKNTRKHAEDRLSGKMKQTKASDGRNIPAYAIVVEFSTPLTLTGQRWKKK